MIAHMPHWLLVTGHIFRVSWPGALLIYGLLITHFAWHLERDIEEYENLQRRAEERAIRLDLELQRALNGDNVRRSLEYAREWQTQYNLRMEICRVQHMDRPLPTIELTAAQREELEGVLPF